MVIDRNSDIIDSVAVAVPHHFHHYSLPTAHWPKNPLSYLCGQPKSHNKINWFLIIFDLCRPEKRLNDKNKIDELNESKLSFGFASNRHTLHSVFFIFCCFVWPKSSHFYQLFLSFSTETDPIAPKSASKLIFCYSFTFTRTNHSAHLSTSSQVDGSSQYREKSFLSSFPQLLLHFSNVISKHSQIEREMKKTLLIFGMRFWSMRTLFIKWSIATLPITLDAHQEVIISWNINYNWPPNHEIGSLDKTLIRPTVQHIRFFPHHSNTSLEFEFDVMASYRRRAIDPFQLRTLRWSSIRAAIEAWPLAQTYKSNRASTIRQEEVSACSPDEARGE